MATELLALRVSLRDELSRPLRGVRREVQQTTAAMHGLGGSRITRGIDGIGRSFKDVAPQVRKFDQQMRTASQAVTGFLGNATRIGVVMGGVAAAGMAAFGFQTAQSFQDIKVSLNAITGDMETANALFNELQEINLRSPFELLDVAGMTTTLLRAGYELENVTSVVENFLSVAAGVGMKSSDLQRVAFNLQQIAQTGFVSMIDIRQMAMAGMPIFEMIEEATGRTAAEMKAMGDEGRVTAEEFLGIFENADSEIIQRYAEMLPTIMTTMSAQLSNFRDKLATIANESMGPLMERMTQFTGPATEIAGGVYQIILPAIGDLIVAFTEVANALAPSVMPVIQTLVSGIGGLFTAMLPAITMMEPVFAELNMALGEMFTELVPVMPELVELFIALIGILPEFVRLLAAFVPLITPLANLATALLSYEPLANIFAGLLVVLLGYRALAGITTIIWGMVASMNGLAASQAAVAATGGLGGVPGGVPGGPGGVLAAGRMAKGVGIAGGVLGVGAGAYQAHQAETAGQGMGGVGTAALSGAMLGATVGSVVPVIGTAFGAAGGALIGAGTAAYAGWMGQRNQQPEAAIHPYEAYAQYQGPATYGAPTQTTSQTTTVVNNFTPGSISVNEVQDPNMVAQQLPGALTDIQRESIERS